MLRLAPLLLPLLLSVLVALPAVGEDEARTTCGMYALLDPDDAGLLATYDGLRKGLELAQLPRVCRHDPTAKTGGIAGFLERQAASAAPLREAGKTIESIFAVGDASCAAVLATRTAHPCVMAVTRYTAKRLPLVALPTPRSGAVVYSDMAAEHVGALIRGMYSTESGGAMLFAPRYREIKTVADAFCTGLGATKTFIRPDPELSEQDAGVFVGVPYRVAAVLALRLDPRQPPADFKSALDQARTHKAPLISDNRAHFGQGAVVVLVPRHDLLGRAAADEARKLRADPKYAPKPRAIPGFEVWVDLAAADDLGVELPLPFLARADKLRRGRPRVKKPKATR